MQLDRDDLALELRRLPARRCAEVERPFAGARADGEAGELRTAALRPDQARFERVLVDPVDVPGRGQVLIRRARNRPREAG